MKISVVGAGYVGLVSGACFADFGHDVTIVDIDPERIASLQDGQIPIYEPGLDELVAKNVAEERLSFTIDLSGAVPDAAVVFLAVGTPARRGDGEADLTFVYNAAREIARVAHDDLVIATKSTVPVGTGDEIARIVSEVCPDIRVSVASNPEFLREGAAITDFKRPDRIVIGVDDEHARQVMSEVYRPLYINQAPTLFSDRRTAELTKYAANAFLATKITFINEMADICDAAGANVQQVARGIGLDNRIGSKFLHAGPGYGGSCFPKDTLALVKSAEALGAPTQIVEAVVAVNDARKRDMGRRIIAACGGDISGKKIALLGLAFKPNTDDMREAPSLAIVGVLRAAGASICAHDPAAMAQARLLNLDVSYADTPYACAEDADAVVIVTEWNVYRALDLDRLKAAMQTPTLVDLRNIYSPQAMAELGFSYTGIGVGRTA